MFTHSSTFISLSFLSPSKMEATQTAGHISVHLISQKKISHTQTCCRKRSNSKEGYGLPESRFGCAKSANALHTYDIENLYGPSLIVFQENLYALPSRHTSVVCVQHGFLRSWPVKLAGWAGSHGWLRVMCLQESPFPHHFFL